jgi:hypothetical protein
VKFKVILFTIFISLYLFSSCEKGADLDPKFTKFDSKIHLKKLDGSEALSKEVKDYLIKQQALRREVASLGHLPSEFDPKNSPKFPLPYFLIPDEMAQFTSFMTEDKSIIDQFLLRISGKVHYKFFIHPGHENQFNDLKGVYTYIDVEQTEFMASPSSDMYTLVVWNRNNEDRKPFLANLTLEKSGAETKLSGQIINSVPVNLTHEKN